MSDRPLTWGDVVRVDANAPNDLRPGELGSVVGWWDFADGRKYTVEYGDGSSAEIPARLIALVQSADAEPGDIRAR